MAICKYLKRSTRFSVGGVNNPLYFGTIAFTCLMFAHNYLSSTANGDKIALDVGIIEEALITKNIRALWRSRFLKYFTHVTCSCISETHMCELTNRLNTYLPNEETESQTIVALVKIHDYFNRRHVSRCFKMMTNNKEYFSSETVALAKYIPAKWKFLIIRNSVIVLCESSSLQGIYRQRDIFRFYNYSAFLLYRYVDE